MGATQKIRLIAKHFQRLLAILGALAVLTVVTGFFFFLGVGHWLVKEDPLQKADAIAVLSGNFPIRAMEAAKLYHLGYAKEIWLTHPGTHSDPLKEFGVRYPSEDDCNYKVLRKEGIPAKAIHILDASVANTADELDVISAALVDTGSQSVIVVTDKPHTRRVHTLWKEFDADRGIAIVRGVTGDSFNPSRWWKTAGGATQVLHEVLGMINASAGLPVQTGIRLQRSIAQNDPHDSQEQQPQQPQHLKIQQPVDSD
ncbi:MAG TPA: YdcF family protein [Candidatus Acidoferrum sp.]